jgi:CRISPR-associated protein Csb3
MTTPNATTFVLRRAEIRTLLSHTALYGLAAIAHDAGLPGIRISWTAGMQPRPCLHGDGIDGEAIGAAVQDHARRHTTADSWVQHDLDLKGTARGLMSPRLGAIGEDPATWQRLQTSRHTVLDQLTQQHRWIDLRLLASLGEPCYWSSNRTWRRRSAPAADGSTSTASTSTSGARPITGSTVTAEPCA